MYFDKNENDICSKFGESPIKSNKRMSLHQDSKLPHICYRDVLDHIQISLKTQSGSCDKNHILIYQQETLMTTI